MKKLILLLFIPLVFTCSSDSSDDNNNNNSNNPSIQKLIESITVISGECGYAENLWLYYDNENRISSYEIQFVEQDCNGQQGYYGPIAEFQVEYVENVLTFSYPVISTLTSPINDDGTINDANLTFVNGYLILEDPNAGGNWELDCERTYVWVDNNLIEINEINENNCDGTQTFYEYSSYINPIPFFWPRNYMGLQLLSN